MTAGVPADRLADEVRRVSAGLLDFVAALIAALSRVFERESAAWGRHRSATIRRAVDEIVESGRADPSADEVLGIRLHSYHLAAVLWPLDVSSDPGWSSDSARWTETVKEWLGAGSTLIVPRTDGSTDVVWSTSAAPIPGRSGNWRRFRCRRASVAPSGTTRPTPTASAGRCSPPAGWRTPPPARSGRGCGSPTSTVRWR
ncbi:hypothetical protein [Streptomyces sp. NPDC020996]|uniref:hypothetical protein n=1 Tax=Streptomyces sp. NPDC020996 TaxID=3154791 RepID=UPI0033C42EA6